MKDYAVALTLKNYRCFSDEHPAQFELSDDFTAFIGPNNVGKSTILKFIYELRMVFAHLSQPNWWYSQSPQRHDLTTFGNPFFPGTGDRSEIFCAHNDRDLSIDIEVRRRSEGSSADLVPALHATINREFVLTAALSHEGQPLTVPIPDDYKYWERDAELRAYDVAGTALDGQPLLSALRQLAEQAVLIPSYRHVFHATGLSDGGHDFELGENVVGAWRTMKNGDDKAAQRVAEDVTREIRSTFGFDSLHIDAHANNRTLQLRVDGTTYRLEEVGTGIAHFISTLVFLATRKPQVVLIDEPEANLHPRLQLDFLRAIARRAPSGVVLSTHSIGLVRASGARAYSLAPSGEGSIVRDFSDPASIPELLGELSFSAYQELGFSKVLLVEGSTEVRAVGEFLRLFGKAAEVVLVSLGGADGIKANAAPQLLEVKRICDDVFVLIDSEKLAEGAELDVSRQAFATACAETGVRCHILERRAFENYLSEHAIRTVSKGSRALAPYEKLSDLGGSAWSKSDNWRIALAMTREDLAGTDLGEFLERL